EGPAGAEQVVAPDSEPIALEEIAEIAEGGELVRRAFAPFDLERGLPLRLGLCRSPGGALLLLSVHHLVADFWSLGVMLRELGALYRQERGGEPAALQPPAP